MKGRDKEKRMKNSTKMAISLSAYALGAAAVIALVFVALTATGCAGQTKTLAVPTENETGILYGLEHICNDDFGDPFDDPAVMTYSRDIVEICITDVDGFVVYDVGCDSADLEVCDSDVSYIIAGGEEKTSSRNCVVSSKAKKKAIKAHLKCLEEVLK